ncbi:MAG: NADH-quinone oxidoreductase subunit J [Desulfurella sp.]|uniref:NADH-quinone oxidoreductase subunit J family protein n=1 Tax=Desulfurella sp. TaxID=1962857 RepID=UPI003CA895DB
MIVEIVVFAILAVMAVGGGFGIIVTKNPFRAAMWMVLSFIGSAGIFVMLDAVFIAMLQLIVYAGAITVMIVIAMYTMDKLTIASLKRFNNQAYFGALFGLGILLDFIVIASKLRINTTLAGKNLSIAGNNIKAISDVLFKSYLLPFEITAIVLLIALFGAVALTKKDI